MTNMTNEMLAVQAKNGDKQAEAILYQRVERLLYYLAKRYYPMCETCGIDKADLQQELYFGFLAAIKTFTPEKGLLFTTVLEFPVKKACRKALHITYGKEIPRQAVSLDVASTDDGMTTFQSLLRDETAEKAMRTVEDNIMVEQLWQAVKQLPEKQGAVIYLRYKQACPAQVIGQKLGLTIYQVRTLERKALQALQTFLKR